MNEKTKLDADFTGSAGLDTVNELADAEIAPSTRFDKTGLDLRTLGLLDEPKIETPASTPPHELFELQEEEPEGEEEEDNFEYSEDEEESEYEEGAG
jgi:hypothetical protein